MKFIAKWVSLLSVLFSVFLFGVSCSRGTTIAFIVKDPAESWFQIEIENAGKAAREHGFQLLAYPDSVLLGDQTYTMERVMLDLQDAADKGANGIIICIPDVYDGDQVIDFCKKNKMKLMTVDDQLKDSSTRSGFNEEVPHVGIDGYRIGRQVGITLAEHMVDRDWNAYSVGIIELWDTDTPDIMARIEGTSLLLKEVLPFKGSNFFRLELLAPTLDGSNRTIQASFKAIESQFENWIVVAQNDECVIGGVRALNQFDVEPAHILAIGINGGSAAVDEMKGPVSGFMGTVKLNAKKHGYETSRVMYRWIAQGKEPDKRIVTNGNLYTRDDDLELMMQ